MTAVPSGYVALAHNGGRSVVRSDVAEAVHHALAGGSLYHFAAQHAERRAMQGRLAAYAIPLTESVRAVVRHNTHGGLLARVTGDRFLAPTRAPRELAASLRLRDAGVATPPVIAIVRYAAGGPFERSDVATEEVADAIDLARILLDDGADHEAAAEATGALLAALARAGARHEDLNIRNVLIQRTGTSVQAHLLDVDRVVFGDSPAAAAHRNRLRFERSARKPRDARGGGASEAWIAKVRRAADR